MSETTLPLPTFLSPIAQPLAEKKLQKRLLKLVKRGKTEAIL